MIEAILPLILQSVDVNEPAVAKDDPVAAEKMDNEAKALVPEAREAAIVSMPDHESAKPVIDIPRDTPVRLMVLTEVSTKNHDPGHRFRLRVNDPVIVKGREVIPVGTIAWGELLSAEKSGNVGKSGKLSAQLLHIDYDGREIALDGEAQAEGKSGKGETILGVLAAGPLGLFAKGNNAKLKAGEMMTAFVAEDVIFAGDLAEEEAAIVAESAEAHQVETLETTIDY